MENEEEFLKDKLQSARHALKLHKDEDNIRKLTKNRLDKELEEIEQACVDYMKGNGLLSTENFTLGTSTSIDVTDIDAVPEEFLRVKITKEPNKILIKELKPAGNWYIETHREYITCK